jgi:hypothetical protein
VSDLPNVDYPVISVNANLPGASRETASAERHAAREAVHHHRRHRVDDLDEHAGPPDHPAVALERNIDAAAQDV